MRALIVENEVQRIDNQSESATTQPKRARATPVTRRRNASQLQTTKKGDTGIRKPPDTSLSDSYSEPKLTLFISGCGIVLKTRQDTPSLHALWVRSITNNNDDEGSRNDIFTPYEFSTNNSIYIALGTISFAVRT
jgi:hypothetical protein